MAALPSPTQVAGTHSAIYEAYYHQVDPNATGAVQAPDAARFLKKSRLSDVVLSKIWDLSDPNGKGYLDKTGLFVALKLVALAQAGKDINMSNIHSEAPPPKVGELPKVLPSHAPARPAAPSPAPSDWSIKPGERDKYNALFDSLQPSNGLIAGNKVKGVLMESKLPLDSLGKIWDLADQDKDGMLDRHEFMVAMHLVYKALEKHAVPTTLPPELRARGAAPPSRPPSRPPSPQPRPPPPRPPPAQSNASLLEGLLDLSSPPSSQPSLIAPLSAQMSAPLGAPLSAPLGAMGASTGSNWVVSAAEKAQYDAMFDVADADRDGLVSGLEIKHTFLESGLPQATLAHIWALCDMEGVGKLNRGQFALAMWLVRRAARGTPPPPALTADMRPPAHANQQLQQPVEPAPTLGPQPTPEMEAIAREVDALARERLALEAEVVARQRELSLNTSEADGLQSELDTLTATLKQLENQKGEAQKRLNDLKTQVEKLRSQVAAQEAAAAETEAEVVGRRAAAATLKQREAALQEEATAAQQQADALTAQLRRTVLAVSQANIKITHLEEQHRLIQAAVEALAAGGAGAASALTLRPAFDAASLERCVGGGEEEEFPASNEFSGTNGFASDPFKDGAFPAPHDPFAPTAPSGHKPEAEGFGRDPFASSGGDPFAGDAFASTDNKQAADGAWQSDPFAVLHAPTRASPTPSLPPKRHKTPPPRPAPPRPNPPTKTGLDFAEDPFKDYRYEDPFNIEDPFKDAVDNRDPFARSSSAVAFQTDDFFSSNMNGTFQKPVQEKRSGRVSAPPVAYDPFSSRSEFKPSASTVSNDNDNWGWKDDWASEDAWSKPATQSKANDAWPDSSKSDWKTDNWANKTDNWAADWSGDQNKNLNETWPSSTLPNKKEKSPKPVKIAKSLVHTIGGIGRTKKDKKKNKETRSSDVLASEEQQWAWAAAESAKLEAEAEERRRREDAELQLALAISRQEK